MVSNNEDTPDELWDEKTITSDLEQCLSNLRKVVQFLHDARVGQALRDLLEHVSLLTIYRGVDQEDEHTLDPLPMYHTRMVRDDSPTTQEWITNVRQDLLDALLTEYGSGPRKRCGIVGGAHGCQQIKRLSEFSRSKDSKDGYQRYCKECERLRVRLYEEKKRRRQEAEEALSPLPRKQCATCGRYRPQDRFHRDRHSVDGYRSECKLCRNKRLTQSRQKAE